jgi:hypothetical protein
MRVSSSNKTRSLNALFGNKTGYLTGLINPTPPVVFFLPSFVIEMDGAGLNSTAPTRSRPDLRPLTPRSFVGKHCVAAEGTCYRSGGTHPEKSRRVKSGRDRDPHAKTGRSRKGTAPVQYREP